jgi:vancomycin resistance protein YoaR
MSSTAGTRPAWRRAVAAFAAGLLLTLFVTIAALLAYDAAHDGRVLTGVRVGTTDLSGLSRDEATAALETAYRGYGEGQVLIATVAGDVTIDYAAFDRRLDVEPLVDLAMAAGRSGTAPERALAEVRFALDGHTLEPGVVFDEVALRDAVEAGFEPLHREPIDARIGMGPYGIMTTHARPGRTFDVAAVQAAAVEAVRRADAPAQVRIEAAAIAIDPERGDDVVLAAERSARDLIGPIVVTAVHKDFTIPAATVRSWVRFTIEPDGAIRPVVDATAIPDALRPIAKEIARKPVSARYLVSKSGKIVGVQAGQPGRALSMKYTTERIVAEIDARAGGAAPAVVRAKGRTVEPELTTEEATKKAPLMSRLATWTTYFPIGERNFWGANIWLPAQIINGTVLQPGQQFEWWRALGPVTRARGFGLGGYIAGNHTDPTGAMGGGMCSASTTLFNAALRAGLDMGARDNHRYYINRYPLGLDATVSSSQTMTFRNDMKTPIYIRGIKSASGGRGYVTFEIWGIDDGRTIAISAPSVRNVREATTQTVLVSTRPRGEREQTEFPADGMDVSITRVVRRDGRVLHRDTYASNYQLWNGRIEVGR